MMVSDVTKINHGCDGAKKVDQAFTIVSLQRTLDLEAPDGDTKSQFFTAFKLLTGK